MTDKTNNTTQLTLGSLFSGSGGFELAGLLTGIEPLWASEIEPFPIRVTTKRLPSVQHLGDIKNIDGSKIPPVDIITGEFPCQNLSVAGKQDGLHGDRSALFFHIPRIIKEMRATTENQYPKYAVLENVPGMFSSNKGADFLEVLNELAKIKDKTISLPMPEKNKWCTAGEILADDYSIAWRTLDAQYFGVAQRRRRVYIVIDFTGQRAGKILFDESRLFGNTLQGDITRKDTVRCAEDCIGEPSGATSTIAFEPGAVSRLGNHSWHEKACTLRADMGDNQLALVIENHPNDSRVKIDESGTVQALTGRMGTGGGNVPLVMNQTKPINPSTQAESAISLEGNGTRPSHKGSGFGEEISFTLNSVERHGVAYSMTTGCYTQVNKEKSPTLAARDYKDAPLVGIEQMDLSRQVKQANDMNNVSDINDIKQIGINDHWCEVFKESEVSSTLTSHYSKNTRIVENKYVVRRLTPTECALLQGFPADWCANLETSEPTEEDIAFWSEVFEMHRLIMGKSKRPKSRNQIVKWLKNPHSDSAEYKLWGNGISLPVVEFVLGGIVSYSQN